MTTALGVVPDGPEDRNDAAARRFRGRFAELRISASAVARQIGMTQAAMSRRMLGKTEFTLNEIDAICAATGISYEYIVLGRDVRNPRPGHPDGGQNNTARPKGFEPLTFWSVVPAPRPAILRERAVARARARRACGGFVVHPWQEGRHGLMPPVLLEAVA